MNEAIRMALTMVAGSVGAILLLMLVAKLTSMTHIPEKEGAAPVYSMEASVKGKRTLVEPNPANPTLPQTRYFVTFHKRDGNRIELEVPGEDYGLAAEGDEGILVWQGSEFVVFKRTH